MSESALDRERKAHQQTKDAAQRDRLEFQQTLDLESQFRTSAWNELLKAFDDPDERDDNGLKELVRVIRWGVLSVQKLRGAPQMDTMRVGHPELTSVEAGAHAGSGKWLMQRWNGKLLRLASELDNELSGSEERRPAVEKPRCRKRGCPEPDKRQPFGAKYCAFCARPMGEAA